EALGATNGSGAFPPVTVTVPASAEPGTHWISVQGRRSGLGAQAAFTVRTDWPQFRFNNKRVGRNPTENVLDPANVGGLDLAWSYTTGDIVAPSPAVVNGMVYVGSDDNNVYALDASTGALVWTYSTGGDVESSPAVANGVVYVGSFDHKIYALDAATGALIWSFTTGHIVFSPPAVANGVVYVGSFDDSVYALDAATGA